MLFNFQNKLRQFPIKLSDTMQFFDYYIRKKTLNLDFKLEAQKEKFNLRLQLSFQFE